MKGIVIIMMVFLHLFNGNHTAECTNLLYIGDVPFAKWLSNACGPVRFFLLFSGYGLAFTYERKGLFFFWSTKENFQIICTLLDYFNSISDNRMVYVSRSVSWDMVAPVD